MVKWMNTNKIIVLIVKAREKINIEVGMMKKWFITFPVVLTVLKDKLRELKG